jgi:hypothetical protein
MRTACCTPVLLVAVTTMTAGSAASPAQGQSAAQYRTVVTGVAVPVIVRAGREPVRDLAREEFVLTDSGVRQQVSAAWGATVPVDLSLIVERTEGSEFLRTGDRRAGAGGPVAGGLRQRGRLGSNTPFEP